MATNPKPVRKIVKGALAADRKLKAMPGDAPTTKKQVKSLGAAVKRAGGQKQDGYGERKLAGQEPMYYFKASSRSTKKGKK